MLDQAGAFGMTAGQTPVSMEIAAQLVQGSARGAHLGILSVICGQICRAASLADATPIDERRRALY
jgi:hypothetical protein